MTVAVALLGTLALTALFADVLSGRPSDATSAITDDATSHVARARALGLGPVVAADPQEVVAAPLSGPSASHPFGTDAIGRDLFARTVYGARTALGLSLGAILLSLFFGATLGLAAGFVTRSARPLLSRFVETVGSFPAIIVVALLRAMDKDSTFSVVVGVAVVRSAEVARIVSTEVSLLAQSDFVVAAHGLGASRWRIAVRHVFPNVVGPVLVSSVFGMASVVLFETSLSFLGLGNRTDAPSWGETLAEAARNPDHPRLLAIPFVMLFMTLIGNYLLADALRDALDPRTARRTVAPPPDFR